MKYLKYFESKESDVAEIEDIIKDFCEDLNLNNIRLSGHSDRDINYFNLTNLKNFDEVLLYLGAEEMMCIYDILANGFKGSKTPNKILENNLYMIYLDLTGPNDFYTIRYKFLKDLELLCDRLKSIGFNARILKHPYSSNKFILYV